MNEKIDRNGLRKESMRLSSENTKEKRMRVVFKASWP
jgi:hypothetical protein